MRSVRRRKIGAIAAKVGARVTVPTARDRYAPHSQLPPVPRADDDLAAILYTSGTTGASDSDADARQSRVEFADAGGLLSGSATRTC